MDFQKLSNQPLILVLAEFRFSDVLDIETYLPKIQGVFRKEFPVMQTRSAQQIEVGTDGSFQMKSLTEWAFIDAHKTQSIILGPNRIVFITNKYDRFDGLLNKCKFALETLIGIVEPALLLRVGLRYSDLIIEDDKGLSQYVKASYFDDDSFSRTGELQQLSKETIVKTESGYLKVRSLFGETDLVTLEDKQGLVVSLPDIPSSRRLILDFDHFWSIEMNNSTEPVEFSLNAILAKLNKLHESSRQAFWDVTTDQGKELWK